MPTACYGRWLKPGMRLIAAALVASFSSSLVADQAHAAPCSSFNTSLGAANTNDVQTSTDCYGLVTQESPPESIAPMIPFGDLPWAFVEKFEAPQNNNQAITFTGTNLKVTLNAPADDSIAGTWEILNPVAGFQYALGIGQGGRYAVYLLSGTSGSWTMASFLNQNGKEQGVSNLSLYSAVPLPAAAWLMMAGFGGLGLVARRRQKVAA